jgi:hypothetical protein
MQVVVLFYLNKKKEAQRVQNGKPAKLKDLSMQNEYVDVDDDNEKQGGVRIGDRGTVFCLILGSVPSNMLSLQPSSI